MLFGQGPSAASTILQVSKAFAAMGLRSFAYAPAAGVGGADQTRCLTSSRDSYARIEDRMRPNNDGTGTQWTRNWTSGRDATRPMPFKGLFGPPFGPRTQRNFLVRR